MDEDESQKTEAPSQYKLEEARKKGDIPKSQDVATLFILVAGIAVLLTFGLKNTAELTRFITVFIEQPEQIAVDGNALQHLSFTIGIKIGIVLSATIGAMIVAGLAGHLVQSGLLFSAEKLIPKLHKISPIAGFKRLFGAESLLTFAKTLLKLVVICWVAYVILVPHAREMSILVQMEPAALMPILVKILLELCFALIGVIAVASVADYAIQRFSWIKRNRMSKQEQKDEYKKLEGDPLIKLKVRQIRIQRSRSRMMSSVPKATVIITNPTHFAVALRYLAGEDAAPVCVAKGVDHIALKIREIATAADVPIVEDPPLARALYASVDLDETIPAQHYEAVAKIIGVILGVAAARKSGDSLQSRVQSAA
ncbi:flagellar biosynthesis protein FlhB [Candidatus Phycosocius spiralis]|uniref:Flagellar biosynthetic protein FlhB n=1 Tax=Candidatus Phycosocius spiralis TaxID=2815099 RepID=A0ABQ4PVA0_9PROT|nr:flagellar biosynthesis protein FlhB [Candidatus Phycosocius spiralis]GIU66941.1 flagellar biosynthesis protein FlhB [Candidatus Phycosocius spiralis]